MVTECKSLMAHHTKRCTMITAQLNFKGSIIELKEYPETMTVEEAYQDFIKV